MKAETISHYRLLGKLGAGGMGEVYLAQDTGLDRKVAIKFLPPESVADPQAKKRLIREAQAAAKLDHANICAIHEVGEEDGHSFIVMQYVEGDTLASALKRKPLTAGEALDLAVEIADALSEAHSHGIIHRDIKPQNIMITPRGQVKVLDFGLAKAAAEPVSADSEAFTQSLLTEPWLIIGTVPYMSPEQVKGEQLDGRSDIFSFGVLLYEMISTRTPFVAETAAATFSAILTRNPEPLARYAPETPTELQRIVSKTLRKDKEERYQTMKDLLLDLKTLKEEMAFEARQAVSVAQGVSHRGAIAAAGGQPEPETATVAIAQPESPATRQTSSSAEYLISQIKHHKRGVVFALAALVVAAIAISYLASQIRQGPQTGQPATQRKLSRLTFDSGLQSEPTWSPDGRFIAYSSDRGGAANFDIWVQPVAGGIPIQLTKSPAHDWQPDWSPDGNSLVFRSERDGGGLFVAPAPTGGNERKISSFGYSPRWSHDGSQILFFSSNDRNATSPPRVFVVGVDGSPPRQVLSEFLAEFVGRWQINWHPDGHISIWGDRRNQGSGLWTVSTTGEAPVKSEVNAEVEKQRLEVAVDLSAFRWSPSGRALYFEGISQGVKNLWKVEVDPRTLRWIAGPERLTVGAGADTDIALSRDGKKLAFVTRAERTRIWSLPFNPATEQVKGPGQPITPVTADAFDPDLTRDAKKLVFVAVRSGKYELLVKSLEDSSEKLLAASDTLRFFVPRWSPNGSQVAYARDRSLIPERAGFQQVAEHSMALISADGGEDQTLTSLHQLQGYPWDWTEDQQWILGSSARELTDHWGLYLFPIAAAPNAENQMRLITERSGYEAYHARFSPDRRWISFRTVSTSDAGQGEVWVVPAEGGEWRRISDGREWSGPPCWSPDGRTIYFISNRFGFTNLWGRRFDPITGQPMGEAFRVTSFESPGQMVARGGSASVAADRLVLPIAEVSGSIWVLENVDR